MYTRRLELAFEPVLCTRACVCRGAANGVTRIDLQRRQLSSEAESAILWPRRFLSSSCFASPTAIQLQSMNLSSHHSHRGCATALSQHKGRDRRARAGLRFSFCSRSPASPSCRSSTHDETLFAALCLPVIAISGAAALCPELTD